MTANLSDIGAGSAGAIVGVGEGDLAALVFGRQPTKLFLFDDWRDPIEFLEEGAVRYRFTREISDGRCEVHGSSHSLHELADGSLDFACLRGDYAYLEGVLRQKLKTGGALYTVSGAI